jgi:hypothetical protein
MIQLANDPNTSRKDWRPAAPGANGFAAEDGRAPRSGHAWPFISRPAERPAALQESQRPARPSTGS